MKTIVNRSEGIRERQLVRNVIWVSIGLALIMASPWRIQAAEAGAVTDDNVAQRVATAKTAEDHEALAAYYRAQAAAKGEDVKRHEAMLKAYDNVQGTSKEVMRSHCQTLINTYRQAQRAFEGLAADHEKLAKAAGGNH